MKKIFIIFLLIFVLASCGTETKIGKVDIKKGDNKAEKTTEVDNVDKNNLQINKQNMEYIKTIVLDTNHPLAGKTLKFDIEIVKIKKASTNKQENVVEKGDDIEVHYTGTFTDGKKFDSSLDRGTPLAFKAGGGQMIPGFDKAVIGMKTGEKKSITLEPKDAYGEKDVNKKQELKLTKQDLENLKKMGYEIKVGEKFPTQFGELTILEVKN